VVQPILDGRNFQIAGALQPFNDDDLPLLQKADPVLFYAIDFWTYIIRRYPGQALVDASLTGSGLADPQGVPIDDAVAQAYPYDVVPYLPSTYIRFPCLAVYRTAAEYTKHSAIYYSDDCSFDLMYILPPLTPSQAESVLPILRAVEQAIKEKTIQSLDPGYTPPGGLLGQTPWGLSFAAVQKIGFERGHLGHLPVGNQVFPFLVMSGKFLERDMYQAAQNLFTGVDINVDLMATDGTRVPAFMGVSTQRAPAITSVSPAVGPIAGGTTITIKGALFLAGAQVVVGTQNATNISVSSDGTTIVCKTPAVGGSGAVDINVFNPDGQTSNLPLAFFFGAPTFVQGTFNNNSGSASTLSQAFGASVTKGSAIVVSIGWGTPGNTVTSVTDGVNVYHAMPSTVGATAAQQFIAYNVAAGATTVVVHWSGSAARPEIVIAEYANLSALPLDATGGSASSGPIATASLITTDVTELLVAYSYQGQKSTGIGAGWNQRVFTGGGFGDVLQDFITTQPGLYTASTKLQASANYAMVVAALHT
jgi:IPT/TIG domain